MYRVSKTHSESPNELALVQRLSRFDNDFTLPRDLMRPFRFFPPAFLLGFKFFMPSLPVCLYFLDGLRQYADAGNYLAEAFLQPMLFSVRPFLSCRRRLAREERNSKKASW